MTTIHIANLCNYCAFRILRQNAHHLPLAGIKRDNWNSTPQSFKRMQKILSIIANVNVLQEHDREKQLTYDEAGQLHARWHFIKCKCLGKYIWRLVSSFKSVERYLYFVGGPNDYNIGSNIQCLCKCILKSQGTKITIQWNGYLSPFHQKVAQNHRSTVLVCYL